MTPAKRKGRADDRLAPYRKVRKPVPPPARVVPDQRRRIEEEAAEREAREAERDTSRGRRTGKADG